MLTEEQFLETCQAFGIKVKTQGKESYQETSLPETDNSWDTASSQSSAPSPISQEPSSDIPMGICSKKSLTVWVRDVMQTVQSFKFGCKNEMSGT